MNFFNFNLTSWRRYSLMILSLFIAVLLWLYVTNLQSPLREQEFRVSLQPSGLPDGMVVEELPDRVSIRVKTIDIKVGGLEAGDFNANIDLSEAKLGENNLPVNVKAPPGVDISRVIPNEVTVQVDKLVQKQVPVKVFLRGTPEPGYSVGEAVLVPNAVLARGPSRALNTIEQVPVTVDVEGASQNLDYTLPLSLQQPGISLSPEVVRVVVPVNITVPYKAVPVRINVTGKPASEYQIDQMTAEPAVVKMYAPSDILSEINEVSTKQINLNGVSGNLKRSVELNLPEGVVLLQPDNVEVTISVVQKPTPETEPESPNEETETDANNDLKESQ
ncbi:MAG: hypothetical protein FH758_08035 [Firmicutes bacterium]|nr:hypothetical protein [Bacillota bacterium]